MDEYPSFDEEYELAHQDELELISQFEDEAFTPNFMARKSRQSLSFSKKSYDTGNKVSSGSALKRGISELDLESGIEIIQPPAKKTREEEEGEGENQGIQIKEDFGVTSKRFPNWNFITVRAFADERLYVKLNNADCAGVEELSETVVRTENGLLNEPFWKLKKRSESNLSKRKSIQNTADQSSEEIKFDSCDLWVERYKPTKYLELLSDEGVNRSLLNWIKFWDKVVFSRERRCLVNKAHEIGQNKDELPAHKIALLCGPPGLGKTTLAHVIASMAGYNAVEVNASDDRTIEFFRTKLEAATQMRSVLGKNQPNCLIFDEIDGAPAASIDYLLKYVNCKIVEKSKKNKKEKGEGKIVKRPIICICNDLYTPSLRALRQQAFVVHVPKISSSKLAQRLLDICKKQNIRTDLSTLTLLSEKSKADIRSCISTLQFLKSKNEHTLKAIDISKTDIGLKDVQNTLFEAWRDILQKPVQNKYEHKKSEAFSKKFEFDYNPINNDRVKTVIRTVQTIGDYEKLRQGVFENMLKLRFPRFQENIIKGLEWMGFSDLIDTKIRCDQNYSLTGYLGYPFVAWHFLFSTNAWPKISYPHEAYENHVKEKRCSQILTDLMRGLQPSFRACMKPRQLLLDILPFLKQILMPTFRPVDPKLFNDREKSNFQSIIDTLIDLNLTYVQQRSSDGVYSYSFDPNIDELTNFNLSTTKSSDVLYNMKQFIAREVEMEKMRRNDHSLPNLESKEKSKEEQHKNKKPKTPSHLQKLTPKSVKIDERERLHFKDFFGRSLEHDKRKKIKRALLKYCNNSKSNIWFCYKEGYNNAVKKDITIFDLLA